MIDAVVMAGGGKIEPLAGQEGVPNKAFLMLQGKPLVGHVISALADAPSVGRIVVVGPARGLKELQEAGYSFDAVDEAGSMLENAAAGLEQVDKDKPCLMVTADIPLLRAPVVESFLALCEPFDHDLYYPILSRECCERSFPETRRTYVKLRDGCFTGGNIILINPRWFFKNRDRLDIFIATRKKPLKLLRLLPFSFLIKFLTRRLSVADLEKELSRIMDCKARAVPCDLVEIGTDVDKISDLEAVNRAFKYGYTVQK